MGLLDGIFDGFSGPGFVARPLRPNLRRAQKLESRGTPATARIVGIRIRRQTDASPDHLEWALELTTRRPAPRCVSVAASDSAMRVWSGSGSATRSGCASTRTPTR